jgi:hypothetical protein
MLLEQQFRFSLASRCYVWVVCGHLVSSENGSYVFPWLWGATRGVWPSGIIGERQLCLLLASECYVRVGKKAQAK